MEIQQPSPALVSEALERVATSRVFAKSGRHKSLLRYLVEKTVAGKPEEVKEYTIALEVFGREAYDPHVDSQVRVEVSKLRERLEKYYAGEGGEDSLRIEIPKGGYAAVFRNVASAAVPAPALAERRQVPEFRFPRWGLAALFAACAVTGLIWAVLRTPKTVSKAAIAILPFEDLSPGKDQEYFCSGITEELVSDLTRLEIFRVLPRSSVARFKGHPTDPQAIGQILDVQAVVEGTVRKDNDNVRISVRLIDTREGFQLWAGTYDRHVGNILEIQRDIGTSVAKVFHLELSETRRALVRQRTRSADAYVDYLRAAHLIDEPDKALEFFRAAVAADPGYALAWAGLASTWNELYNWEMTPRETAQPEALAAAAKAISLDPQLAEAQHAWGVAKLYYERDWNAAAQALKKATELDPSNGDHYFEYSRLILTPTGRFNESADVMRRAVTLEPFRGALHYQLASNYLRAGKFEAALPEIEAARKLVPHAPSHIVLQGMAAAGRGRYEEALRQFEDAAKLKRSSWVLSHLGFALGKLGRVDEAKAVLGELEKKASGGSPAEFELAAVYAGLGERERAMAGLERATAAFSMAVLWINVDYRLDDLRGDPRFPALVKTVGLSAERSSEGHSAVNVQRTSGRGGLE